MTESIVRGRCKACGEISEFPLHLTGLTVYCKKCGKGWIPLTGVVSESTPEPTAKTEPIELTTQPPPDTSADLVVLQNTPSTDPILLKTEPLREVELAQSKADKPKSNDFPKFSESVFEERLQGLHDSYDISKYAYYCLVLILLGTASLVLPYLGLQLRIMKPLEPIQPFLGILLIAAGIVALIYTRQQSH